MQQPLCHLYFATVMEHFWSKHQDKTEGQIKLSTFVRVADYIQKQLDTSEGKQSILLWVEFQAVVQNLIQELSYYLSPSHPYKLGDVHSLLKDINKSVFYLVLNHLFILSSSHHVFSILSSPKMGQDANLRHGMVLSVQLLKLLKSSRKFLMLLTKNYDSVNSIQCIEPVHHKLRVQ